MRENLSYCVILPAFNEARHLAAVVGRIPAWIDGIIIVDDAQQRRHSASGPRAGR